MTTPLHTLSFTDWRIKPHHEDVEAITSAIESGKVIFLPSLHFEITPSEKHLLSPHISNGKSKNVSFDSQKNALRGTRVNGEQREALLKLMTRFSTESTNFVRNLLPYYAKALQIGRTSFRPVETQNRRAPSYKKDDTRLHVDAFPSTPNQGRRILRVFSNINPQHQPRTWRIGENFETVAKHFLPKIQKPLFGSQYLLKMLKITKTVRTHYDHYMLHIHDSMKKDKKYQESVNATEMNFPAQSTWVVFTDQVSHAALAGQHLLEQTFYLPVHSMQDEAKSPLRVLERLTGRKLI